MPSKCIECKKIRPNFGYEDNKVATYCNDCKKDGMIDIKNKKCKTELCLTHVCNKNYEGYCAYCFRHIFPDKPMSRNYKTKEYAVVDFIKINFTDIDIIYNRKISDGCSGKLPLKRTSGTFLVNHIQSSIFLENVQLVLGLTNVQS